MFNFTNTRALIEPLGFPYVSRTANLSASTSTNIILSTNVRRISIYSTVDCFFVIGNGSQTADSNSHFIGVGERLEFSLNIINPNIAFYSSNSGNVYISELINSN